MSIRRAVMIKRDNYPEGGAYIVSVSIENVMRKLGFAIVDCYVHAKEIVWEENGSKCVLGSVNGLPAFLHSTLQNIAVRRKLTDGDLVIVQHGNALFLPHRFRRVVYVHHSSAYRYIDDLRWKSFARKCANLGAIGYYFLIELLQHPTLQLFNSNYSLKRGRHMHAQNGKKVLFPPVPFTPLPASTPKNLNPIVSIGRIHPEKRHSIQLGIAKKFPSLNFLMFGFGYEKDPYVQRIISEAGSADNVSLQLKAPDEQVHAALHSARYFFHTMRGEHFGIAIAQAAMHGCVLILQERGGAPEIAPAQTIAWKEPEELDAIFTKILNESIALRPNRAEMERIIKEFSVETFEQRFADAIRPYV